MSQDVIGRNPDLKKLREEGFEIEIKGGLLLVRHIPYVNANREIKYGVFVCELTFISPEQIAPPMNHVMMFQGEQPCDKNGAVISAIVNHDQTQDLQYGVTINRAFSSKPPNGYIDFYHKVTTYTAILSSPAQAIDPSSTAHTFFVSADNLEDSVFHYQDTNSSRAKIQMLSAKLEGQKIGVIGLGGTGSYILDFLAKTPVAEIHMFDHDYFNLHNAFRSPGAPSALELKEPKRKVMYFFGIYSKMHKGIVPHEHNVGEDNLDVLKSLTFVFISIDKGAVKKAIMKFLVDNDIPFIDVGMGVLNIQNQLIGTLRTTLASKEKSDHVQNRISVADEADGDYNTNIQIAELNAINAGMAIIKWKKMYGFYHDALFEHHSTFTINDSLLLNEDYSD